MVKKTDAAQQHLDLVRAKKLKFRREQACLPFSEKIRLVIEIQKMAKKFKRDSSRLIYVWTL